MKLIPGVWSGKWKIPEPERMEGWQVGGMEGWGCREGNVVAAENWKLKTSK